MNRFRCTIFRATPHRLFLLFALAGASLSAQDTGGNGAGPSEVPPKPPVLYQTPAARERLHRYVLDAFGPAAFFASGIAAATDQFQDDPPEWKQAAAGFGHRFGSRLGQSAVAETARYGLAAMLNLDTEYHRCDCRGALPRLGHALLSSVTARSAGGRRVISIPDLVGPYAGGLVATSAWYPSRFGPKDGMRLGTWAFGMRTGVNIVREFLPRRR